MFCVDDNSFIHITFTLAVFEDVFFRLKSPYIHILISELTPCHFFQKNIFILGCLAGQKMQNIKKIEFSDTYGSIWRGTIALFHVSSPRRWINRSLRVKIQFFHFFFGPHCISQNCGNYIFHIFPIFYINFILNLGVRCVNLLFNIYLPSLHIPFGGLYVYIFVYI